MPPALQNRVVYLLSACFSNIFSNLERGHRGRSGNWKMHLVEKKLPVCKAVQLGRGLKPKIWSRTLPRRCKERKVAIRSGPTGAVGEDPTAKRRRSLQLLYQCALTQFIHRWVKKAVNCEHWQIGGILLRRAQRRNNGRWPCSFSHMQSPLRWRQTLACSQQVGGQSCPLSGSRLISWCRSRRCSS